MAVFELTDVVLDNFCIVLSVFFETIAGDVSLVMMVMKSAIVDSLLDTDIALLAWVVFSVSVDNSVNIEVIDV